MYHLIIADDEEKICEGIARLFPWEQFGFCLLYTSDAADE